MVRAMLTTKSVLIPSVCLGLGFSPVVLGGRFNVPAVAADKPTQVVSKETLLSGILSENELGNQGVITDLVVRPEKNVREVVSEAKLTLSNVEGDRGSKEDQEINAVTLMRSDVSRTIGGAHIPGDNIHVEGLHIGEDHLQAGDLVVISNENIKSVLLKTHMPHYACWKFESRCGGIAYDFVNSEGDYENGIFKNPGTQEGWIHGLQHRLRGIRLVVLKEGTVVRGDQVTIVRAQDFEDFLIQNGISPGEKEELQEARQKWLDASRSPAEKEEKNQKAKVEVRKKKKLRTESSS